MGRGHRLTDLTPEMTFPLGCTESDSNNHIPRGVFPLTAIQPPQAPVKNKGWVKLTLSPGSRSPSMEKVAHQPFGTPGDQANSRPAPTISLLLQFQLISSHFSPFEKADPLWTTPEQGREEELAWPGSQ